MSADSDPVKDPAKNHSTKADPAAAERLREEFFKIQSATSDSYRIADLAKDAPKPLLDTVRRRPAILKIGRLTRVGWNLRAFACAVGTGCEVIGRLLTRNLGQRVVWQWP